MKVPEFQEFMLPILIIFKDKKEHNIKECIDAVIKHFALTNEETKHVECCSVLYLKDSIQ